MNNYDFVDLLNYKAKAENSYSQFHRRHQLEMPAFTSIVLASYVCVFTYFAYSLETEHMHKVNALALTEFIVSGGRPDEIGLTVNIPTWVHVTSF